MDQDIVELEVTMHDIDRVEGLAASDNLLDATHRKSLFEAPVQVEESLQGATICEFKNTVVIALRFDDLYLLDDVRTVNHRQKDNLSAE